MFKALSGSPGRAFSYPADNCNPALGGVYSKDVPGNCAVIGFPARKDEKRVQNVCGEYMSNIRIPEQAEPFSLPNLPEESCITLIGMAGAGKTTLGRLVARSLDWAFADSDHIIEAAFGAPLQSVTDRMTKDAFIDLEADMVCDLRFTRTVISHPTYRTFRRTVADSAKANSNLCCQTHPTCRTFRRIVADSAKGLSTLCR